jgi:predicted RNase H-like HicB family nuclease
LLEQGRAIAERYTITIQPSGPHGYSGSAVEFPTVFTHGRSPEECFRKTREALMVGVAVMLEMGDTPPLPAAENSRDQQVNIRLTSHEKLLIESLAKRRGYRGISDFMRTAALSQTRRIA